MRYTPLYMQNRVQEQYTIHKYPLVNQTVLRLPKGSKILKVAVQHSQIMLWAAVPFTFTNTANYKVHINGTGWTIDVPLEYYVDTIQDEDFVWHIFLEPEL